MNKDVASKLLDNAVTIKAAASRVHSAADQSDKYSGEVKAPSALSIVKKSDDQVKASYKAISELAIEGTGSGTVTLLAGDIQRWRQRLKDSQQTDSRGRPFYDHVALYKFAAGVSKAADKFAELAIRELDAPGAIVQPIDPGSGIG